MTITAKVNKNFTKTNAFEEGKELNAKNKKTRLHHKRRNAQQMTQQGVKRKDIYSYKMADSL